MKSYSVLVAGFAALAQAVKLTNSDFTITAGQPFTITWSEADGPVTLTLKNGANTDLKTVETITSGATGSSFTWTPSTDLSNSPYALEITDSSGVPNYSTQFNVAGATGTASASGSASASASASASGSSSAASSVVSSTVTSAASSSSASQTAATVSSAANSTIASSTTVATSTRASSTRTSATSGSTTAPTTVPGGDAGRLGSPIALIGLTIAAMLYFQ